MNMENVDSRYLIHPNYGVIAYDGTFQSSTVLLDFKNSTNNPVLVAPSSTNLASSVEIYFDDVEVERLDD